MQKHKLATLLCCDGWLETHDQLGGSSNARVLWQWAAGAEQHAPRPLLFYKRTTAMAGNADNDNLQLA